MPVQQTGDTLCPTLARLSPSHGWRRQLVDKVEVLVDRLHSPAGLPQIVCDARPRPSIEDNDMGRRGFACDAIQRLSSLAFALRQLLVDWNDSGILQADNFDQLRPGTFPCRLSCVVD